jgi:hypothetical protein
MGWEKRGSHEYYYRKEREGSRVKSVYVGRGEIAHLISQFESSSAELEQLMRARKSIEAHDSEKAELLLEQAVELARLFTQATLLAGGFHTHHRQWRRKRKCR